MLDFLGLAALATSLRKLTAKCEGGCGSKVEQPVALWQHTLATNVKRVLSTGKKTATKANTKADIDLEEEIEIYSKRAEKQMLASYRVAESGHHGAIHSP